MYTLFATYVPLLAKQQAAHTSYIQILHRSVIHLRSNQDIVNILACRTLSSVSQMSLLHTIMIRVRKWKRLFRFNDMENGLISLT